MKTAHSALSKRADTQKQLDKLEKELDKEAHRLLKIEDKRKKGEWRSKHESSFTIKINVMRILHDWEREFGIGRTVGSTDREALLKKLESVSAKGR